jgi:stress-induced morphogen
MNHWDDVVALIHKRLKNVSLEALQIIDDSAEHVGHLQHHAWHVTLVITSASLSKLPLLAAHRCILTSLSDLIETGKVHAIRIQFVEPSD